jgi:hypothetical protein
MSKAVNLTSGRKEESFTSETLRQYVFDAVNKFFCAHIPVESIQEMPQYYMYLFGLVAYLISFFLFFVFIYTSYTAAVQQPFMSLQNGPLCTDVSINVTQQLMADRNGNWLGQAEFLYQYCTFDIQLNLFQGTFQDFSYAMNQIYLETMKLGSLSVNQNLALNIIYWMNYILEIPAADSVVLFSYSGVVNQVYNLKYFHGQVSYVIADCPLTSLSSYDMANGLLEAEYNYSQFAANDFCSGAVNPYSLGFIKTLDGNLLKFALNVESFQLALGVNLGVVPIDQLLIVPESNLTVPFLNVSYDNVTLSMAAYFSYRSPYMDPIYCVNNVTGISSSFSEGSLLYQISNGGAVCVVNMGDIYGLPVFNSWGGSLDEPDYCDCDTTAGHHVNCQNFDFISGLLFYNSPRTEEVNGVASFEKLLAIELAGLIGLLNKTQTYVALNRDAYNASFVSSYSVDNEAENNKESNPLFKEPAWRRNAYEFCRIENPHYNQSDSELAEFLTCSLITFNSFDPITRGVSEYKYQLTRGSCYDSFTVSNQTW